MFLRRLYILFLLFINCYGSLIRKDLLIILDCSKSISRSDYEFQIGFISSLVNFLSVSPSSTRVALITFSGKARLEFSFEKCVNRECVQNRLLKILERPKGGKTNIDAALRKAVHVFKKYRGFAKDKLIYLISDGKFNEGDNPRRSVEKLKSHGVKIHVFAVGRSPDVSNLLKIASSKEKYYTRLKNDWRHQKQIIKRLTNRKESYVKCNGRGIVYDECNRECRCVNGIFRNCHRVRKEFTALTLKERKRYLQAYYKITTEEPLKSKMKKFLHIHAANFWSGIHNRYLFFPWHRWYVYEFENLMRHADCRVTVPFWDWSYWRNVVWDIGVHIWRNDEYGFGGDGVKSKDFCVQTGPFNETSWSHPAVENVNSVLSSISDVTGQCDAVHQGDHKPCLRRSFNLKCANLAHVLQTIDIPCSNFKKFDFIVRGGYHNDLHNFIGGQMSSDYASNAPEFFLHHAQLDNIWYRWQMKSSECEFAYFPKNVSKLLAAPYLSTDFIDSSDQGESVRVKYDDFLSKVLREGAYIGEPTNSVDRQFQCGSSDADSSVELPRSPFTILKEQMMSEKDFE